MEHIEEKTLELYVLGYLENTEERADIEKHLNECKGCQASYQEIADYYTEVEDMHEQRLKTTPQALTVRRMVTRFQTFQETLSPRNIKPTLPARFMFFVLRHPAVSSVCFTAIVFASLILGTIDFKSKDTNPEYARAKDEFLVVYNKSGEELWRKHIGIGYGLENLRDQEPSLDPDEYLQTVDVDGDGKKEVIAIFGMLSKWQPKNVIYCYTSDGDERWTYRFNRQMIFGNNIFDDTYQFGKFLVGDFDRNGSFEIIAVIHHGGWYPTAITKVDATEGKLINEYWHCGSIHALTNRDLDNDGIEEIIATGQNNGFNLASVLVLDPRNFQGHSPAPEEYTPKDISIGTENFYLLINRTDLKKYASHPRNRARGLSFTSDTALIVCVTEEIDRTEYVLLYFFSPKLQCLMVDGEDKFATLHNKYVADGKLSKKLDEQYYEELRQGVQYWDGERFVAYPTKNKNYLNLTRQKTLP
ncbi:MAG: VCBS repeat-containing protein [Bacteroidota bacterium]|nr:VCBS repeat-containing protein [Bacteroidota bacterium]